MLAQVLWLVVLMAKEDHLSLIYTAVKDGAPLGNWRVKPAGGSLQDKGL